MRVHFSNVDFNSRSGPNSFGGRLRSALERRGVQVVPHTQPHEIYLAFIQPATQPWPGAKIVQRLDGIWFHPDQYHTHNTPIKYLYDRTHAVVFQTDFDKRMVEHWWGACRSAVIRNGIDVRSTQEGCISPHTFEDSGQVTTLESEKGRLAHYLQELEAKNVPLFACSANWHGQKRLSANLEMFEGIHRSHPNAQMTVLGALDDISLGMIQAHENVRWMGSLSHEDCLVLFRYAAKSNGWFLHAAWLDHCPNAVIEAISQGCPVICTDSGGTKEIVGKNGLILTDHPYNYELFDYDKPPHLDLTNFRLPQRPTVDRMSVDIGPVADAYIALFKELLRG